MKTLHRGFPRTVTLPDGTVVTPALVVVADGQVGVWAARTDWPDGQRAARHNVTRVLLAGLVGPMPAAGPAGVHIPTDVGVVAATPAAGCGCRHPLKRFRPTVDDWSAG